MRSLAAATLAGLALAACSSTGSIPFTPSGPYDAPPKNFAGFPPQTLQGIVFASARWVHDQDELFGVDLIEKAHVIPVAVTVRLRGERQSEAQVLLNPERLNPELVLEDGTPLRALNVEEVVARVPDRYAARLRKRALRTGLVSADGDEGFLFFALEPAKAFSFDGARVTHEADARTRVLDVGASLVSLTVTVNGTLQAFYLGLEH